MIVDEISYNILRLVSFNNADISRLFKTTKYSYATILNRVKALERMGFLKLERDGRKYNIELTEKGKKAFECMRFLRGEI
ncbi:MAG: hypothetical protein DRP00_01665 [Candidatus Aenigmatarchaeota archaeon]|nr:MAG: hypothetical protein DRP00_01665 [Candidatus Aenigmarchaeota archaeon]